MENLPITLYPSKLKNILLLAVCLAFVSIIIYVNNTQEFVYWVSLILFGLGAIVFLIQIIFPNSSYLKITEKGIEIRSLFKSSFMPWKIIEGFELGLIPIRFRRKKMIMINFDKTYNKQNFGRELAKSMTEFEGGLPDNYGMKHEELINLLNDYKNKFKN